jgi:hypothetical protein
LIQFSTDRITAKTAKMLGLMAVLHDQGIAFVPSGIAAVKAVVLAKFMLIDSVMKSASAILTAR